MQTILVLLHNEKIPQRQHHKTVLVLASLNEYCMWYDKKRMKVTKKLCFLGWSDNCGFLYQEKAYYNKSLRNSTILPSALSRHKTAKRCSVLLRLRCTIKRNSKDHYFASTKKLNNRSIFGPLKNKMRRKQISQKTCWLVSLKIIKNMTLLRLIVINVNDILYIAKTKYRNFETNIPRKGISGSQSQFPHSCVCEWFIQYILTTGLPILLEEICGPILGLYKSLTGTWM